jgi:hypothetical protein
VIKTSKLFVAFSAILCALPAFAQTRPTPQLAGDEMTSVPRKRAPVVPILAPRPPTIVPAPMPVPIPRKAYVRPSTLRGSSIFVYSFLDVRERQFGPKVLDQVDQQLIVRLRYSGIQAKILRFHDSNPGKYFMASPGTSSGSFLYGYSRSSVDHVPIGEVVYSNLAAEREAGARYRMLILPSDYQSVGAWQYYTIRWIIQDIDSFQTVWSYEYSGRHLMLWKPDENAAKRGKKFIDNALTALTATGLL